MYTRSKGTRKQVMTAAATAELHCSAHLVFQRGHKNGPTTVPQSYGGEDSSALLYLIFFFK